VLTVPAAISVVIPAALTGVMMMPAAIAGMIPPAAMTRNVTVNAPVVTVTATAVPVRKIPDRTAPAAAVMVADAPATGSRQRCRWWARELYSAAYPARRHLA
jgi:hypothetical protein